MGRIGGTGIPRAGETGRTEAPPADGPEESVPRRLDEFDQNAAGVLGVDEVDS